MEKRPVVSAMAILYQMQSLDSKCPAEKNTAAYQPTADHRCTMKPAETRQPLDSSTISAFLG